MALPKLDLDSLTPDERLALIERIWDSLSPEQVSLSSAQHDELQRRLEDLERNPGDGVSWEAAQRQIREREEVRLQIRQAALQDLDDAYAWYEAQRLGLGIEFLASVDRVLANVAESPLRHRIVVLDTRQALVRRFPYQVLYRILGDEVVVVACFHARRDPRRWEQRR